MGRDSSGGLESTVLLLGVVSVLVVVVVLGGAVLTLLVAGDPGVPAVRKAAGAVTRPGGQLSRPLPLDVDALIFASRMRWWTCCSRRARRNP